MSKKQSSNFLCKTVAKLLLKTDYTASGCVHGFAIFTHHTSSAIVPGIQQELLQKKPCLTQ